MTTATNPLDIQIGGDHYKGFAIQPIEYIHKNDIGFIAGCIIKRMARFNQIGGKGAQDIEKSIHELDILIAQIQGGAFPYSTYSMETSLPITPGAFCFANGFKTRPADIIGLVTRFNLEGNGTEDLLKARRIAVDLLSDMGAIA